MTDTPTGNGSDARAVPHLPFPAVRLLYAIGFAVAAWIVFLIVVLLAVFQFVVVAVNGKTNDEIKSLSLNLVQYLWNCSHSPRSYATSSRFLSARSRTQVRRPFEAGSVMRLFVLGCMPRKLPPRRPGGRSAAALCRWRKLRCCPVNAHGDRRRCQPKVVGHILDPPLAYHAAVVLRICPNVRSCRLVDKMANVAGSRPGTAARRSGTCGDGSARSLRWRLFARIGVCTSTRSA